MVSYTTWMDEAELLAALPAFLRMGAEGEQAFNAALNALPENLDPVHRALHIHAHLGALDEVAQFYVNNRLPQVRLLLLLLLLLRPHHRHRHRIASASLTYGTMPCMYSVLSLNDPGEPPHNNHQCLLVLVLVLGRPRGGVGGALPGHAGVLLRLLCHGAPAAASHRAPGGAAAPDQAGGGLGGHPAGPLPAARGPLRLARQPASLHPGTSGPRSIDTCVPVAIQFKPLLRPPPSFRVPTAEADGPPRGLHTRGGLLPLQHAAPPRYGPRPPHPLPPGTAAVFGGDAPFFFGGGGLVGPDA